MKRLVRRLIKAVAVIPVMVSIALLCLYTARTHPDAPAVLLRLLAGGREDEGPVRYLSRFRDEEDLDRWRRTGAELSGFEGWGKILFLKGRKYSGVRLTDYISGPGGMKDWSPYRFLRWEVGVPGAEPVPFDIMVKDAGDRRFRKRLTAKGGQIRAEEFDLAAMAPWIDLTRVAEVHLFMAKVAEETVLGIRELRLERGDGPPGAVLGKPFVRFGGLTAPARAARGGLPIAMTVSLSLTERTELPFSVFVHLFPELAREAKEISKVPGYIHVERAPFVPTTEWTPGEPGEVGQFSVYFPKNHPPGRYLIQAGLFNAASSGRGPRNVPCLGAFDYGGSYPKCRYTDPALRDFTVGTIEVE